MLAHIRALPAARQHDDSPVDTGERRTRPMDPVPRDVTCWSPPVPPNYGPGSQPFGLHLARRRNLLGCNPPVNSV